MACRIPGKEDFARTVEYFEDELPRIGVTVRLDAPIRDAGELAEFDCVVVATGVVPSLDAHPLPRLLAAGVPVVLGSDDPPMFGTSLLEEYRRVLDHLGLTADQLQALARASFEASFAPAALKHRLLAPDAPGGDGPSAPA